MDRGSFTIPEANCNMKEDTLKDCAQDMADISMVSVNQLINTFFHLNEVDCFKIVV